MTIMLGIIVFLQFCMVVILLDILQVISSKRTRGILL